MEESEVVLRVTLEETIADRLNGDDGATGATGNDGCDVGGVMEAPGEEPKELEPAMRSGRAKGPGIGYAVVRLNEKDPVLGGLANVRMDAFMDPTGARELLLRNDAARLALAVANPSASSTPTKAKRGIVGPVALPIGPSMPTDAELGMVATGGGRGSRAVVSAVAGSTPDGMVNRCRLEAKFDAGGDGVGA